MAGAVQRRVPLGVDRVTSGQYVQHRSAPAGVGAGRGRGCPDEWTDIFLEAGYYEQTWLDLGSLFSEWVHNHDANTAADLVNAFESTDGVGDDNGFAGYLAVQCSDTQWPALP